MQRAKEIFPDNPGHNIMKLHNVLALFQFATSKTKLDIYYNKSGIRVASRVAKRPKTYDLTKLAGIRGTQTWVET